MTPDALQHLEIKLRTGQNSLNRIDIQEIKKEERRKYMRFQDECWNLYGGIIEHLLSWDPVKGWLQE